MRDHGELASFGVPPGWRICPLAPYAKQRQAVAMLFRELAVSVRRKLNLEQALAGIATTRAIRPGAQYVHLVAFVLVAAVLLVLHLFGGLTPAVGVLVAVIVWGPFLALSVRPYDDFLRFVADRLAQKMWQGMTLAEAMASMRLTFTEEERRVVEIGERTGRLAEALESLSEFDRLTGRFVRLTTAIVYPLFVLCICSVIVGFISVKIIPKYADIFAQMGLEFPEFSRRVLFGGPASILDVFNDLRYWIYPMVVFAAVVTIVPRMMGGSLRMMGFYVALPMIVGIVIFLPEFFVEYDMEELARNLGGAALLCALWGVILSVVYLITRYSNALFHDWRQEFLTGPLSGWIGPIRKANLARFLFSLGHALQARIPLPDAIEMAGRTAHGRLRREAATLRAMIENGHDMAERIRQSPVFKGRVGALLALSEWRGSLPEDCIDLAESLLDEVQRSVDRVASFVEWPAIILVGLFLGAFAVACYWPLFYIPHAVGAMQ